MKRSDKIKLNFTRNWKFPGRERLSGLLKPSTHIKEDMSGGIVWLTDEDIAIYANADSYIESTILSTGTYENEINKLIRISLQPGACALDIGANIGLQSLRMAACVGAKGKVYAFEPLFHLQEKFNANMALNRAKNVTLFPFALSNVRSEADFKVNKSSWNQGTFSISGNSQGNETQHVKIEVADEIPELNELEKLDLVKIDVEGFEFPVLLGLKKILETHRPRIIFEYDQNYWQSNSLSFGDCFGFLSSMGYAIYQITPVGCEPVREPYSVSSGNLFCRSHEE